MIYPFVFLWIFIAFFGADTAVADQPVKKVVSTSPSWNTFTNKDGTGLYHEILSAIFQPLGIKVIHKYTNAKRGVNMVQKNTADFYTCRNEIHDFDDLMLARYPMYVGAYHAIFKKDKFPHWQGARSLKDHIVVWRNGYYTASDFPVTFKILEADSGPSAFSQIVFDRADFYIDDLTLIKQSIAENKFSFRIEDYRIETVGKRSYHPVFKKSDRGRIIMTLFDHGIIELHKSGKLRKIFAKWNHPYPDYDSF